jgi:SAM-dependent methyltransferase
MSLVALLEHPRVFGLTQKLNPMTVSLYRGLVEHHVVVPANGAVLDIGCGVGAHRPLFTDCRYSGIDINPAYVARATQLHGDGFHVMDAGALDFRSDTFDAAFTVATCHHLDDGTIRSMVAEAMRVINHGGAFHIIDPVLPVSRRATLKRMLFTHDRGRYQRTVGQLTELLAQHARLTSVEVRSGILHDVCYVRLTS